MPIDPGTAMLISTGANLGAGGLSGGQEQAKGNLHLVDQGQLAQRNAMIAGLRGGGGDFGFGTNVKQGQRQLQNLMAQRGVSIDPRSGAYAGAYGNMVGQAAAADQGARRDYMMNLLRSPLQIASSTGHNFLPTSPSQGYLGESMDDSFRTNNQAGYRPAMQARWSPGNQPGGQGVIYGSDVAQNIINTEQGWKA